MKGLKYSILTILLVLGVTEIVFRATGTLLLAQFQAKNTVEAADAERFRILTLGESTTADSEAVNGLSWPRILEKKLRASGINARVYNEGMRATVTPIIAHHLPLYLEKYRPHVVISMMGINDRPGFAFRETEQNEIYAKLMQVRIVRIGAWIGDAVNALLSCPISENKLTPWHFELAEKAVALSRERSEEGLAEFVAEQIAASRRNAEDEALVLTRVCTKLWMAAKPTAGRPYYACQRALKLYPRNYSVAIGGLHILQQEGKMNEVIDLGEALLKCGRNLPDDLLLVIAQVAIKNKDPRLASELYRERGIISDKTNSDVVTPETYRAIHKHIRNSGAHHIAMQYPTLPVAQLRSYFSESEAVRAPSSGHISFVSNEENFKNALRNKKFEDVFYDRFAGTWGHATIFGNELIAESVMQAVLPIYRELGTR